MHVWNVSLANNFTGILVGINRTPILHCFQPTNTIYLYKTVANTSAHTSVNSTLVNIYTICSNLASYRVCCGNSTQKAVVFQIVIQIVALHDSFILYCNMDEEKGRVEEIPSTLIQSGGIVIVRNVLHAFRPLLTGHLELCRSITVVMGSGINFRICLESGCCPGCHVSARDFLGEAPKCCFHKSCTAQQQCWHSEGQHHLYATMCRMGQPCSQGEITLSIHTPCCACIHYTIP